MIRKATRGDLSGIFKLVSLLHSSARVPLAICKATTEAFISRLIGSDLAIVLVSESDGTLTGCLIGSVGMSSISMQPVAIEHAWYAEGGDGLRLLRRYEQWAREQGCFAARMSTPPHNQRAAQILDRLGFDLAEQAWVKVL